MKVPAFFTRPALDAFRGLEVVLAKGDGRSLVLVFLGLLVGYWIYVPIHELAHAFACLATGGRVTRLEIDPLYGADLLAGVFPWVVSGSEYAGRLSGFDTGGSDLVYLATDLGPFLFTVFPAIVWLRWAARRERAMLFGAALPWALAPFMSLTGDAYEIGSILVTELPPWSEPTLQTLLRGDDLGKKVSELLASPTPAWGGLGLATLLGALWAFGTYALGGWVAGKLHQPPVVAPTRN